MYFVHRSGREKCSATESLAASAWVPCFGGCFDETEYPEPTPPKHAFAVSVRGSVVCHEIGESMAPSARSAIA